MPQKTVEGLCALPVHARKGVFVSHASQSEITGRKRKACLGSWLIVCFLINLLLKKKKRLKRRGKLTGASATLDLVFAAQAGRRPSLQTKVI